MPRNALFDRNRQWRPEDDVHDTLYLDAGQGAPIGEYDPYTSGEYSDSYYGPHDDYAQEGSGSGYNRFEEDPVPHEAAHMLSARPHGRMPSAHRTGHQLYGEVRSYGELQRGERSWADFGVHSVPTERGDHRGRGPKGYRRSDERLQEIVCDYLSEDPRVDVSDIEVAVKDGVITLTGSVPHRRDKHIVEDIVAHCSNDAEIHNWLTHQRAW